jgi:hypothetical protein
MSSPENPLLVSAVRDSKSKLSMLAFQGIPDGEPLLMDHIFWPEKPMLGNLY